MQIIPQIAEIVNIVKGLSESEYEEWKEEVLENTDYRAIAFIEKVFLVIEKYL